MNKATALIAALEAYETTDPEEAEMHDRMLHFARTTPDCLYRSHIAGHMTASAFVLDQSLDHVLLIHHKKLDRWLQPGGHADGEPDLLAVAQKEVEEETGLLTIPLQTTIFDLDIHLIPARKEVPAHLHYDLRFLLLRKKDTILQGNDEVNGLKWVKIEDIKQYVADRSVLRMAEKCTPNFLKKVIKTGM